jgi:hypothetical protein
MGHSHKATTMPRMRIPLLVLLAAWLPPQAMAARPFVTDDARLTTAGSCQLETWARSYRDSHEFWAMPACNPVGNLEFTFGGGRAHNEGQRGTNDHVFQLKTLFRPLSTNDWGWGLSVGTVRHPNINPGPNLFGNTYAYVPMSFSFQDDRVVVHANVGWLKERGTQRNNATWGFGGELQATPRVMLIAEAFGDHRQNPYWQMGGRLAVVPNRVQLDLTVGRQFAGSTASRWVSLGLRWTPDELY